jgi:glycosyltransferase involved in cell wall biosynthesis
MAVSVSVVIPTYNRAALLARCIRSLKSSAVSELEIVVVDDGSTDETPAVARSVEGVVYIRQANTGPALARNAGFAASRGRYVVFLDSDDEWIARVPARLIAQLDANPDIPLVFGDTLVGSPAVGFASFIDRYGGETFDALPYERRPGGLRLLERRPFFRQLSTRNVMFLGSLVIRRQFFESAGRFDPRLRGAADWEFFMRVAAGRPVAFSEGPAVSRYFKHTEGMATDSDHMERDFILALDAVRTRCGLDAADRAHINAQLRRHTFGWAYQAFDRGELTVARERLHWASELGQMRAREAMFLATTFLPPRVVQALRRAKHVLDSRPEADLLDQSSRGSR